MIIELDGILEIGGERSQALPVNARKTIRFTRGEDVLIKLTMYRSDGTSYSVAVAALVFTIKKIPADGSALVEAAVAMFGPTSPTGRCEFTLAGARTKLLQAGRYVYDVWLTEPGTGLRQPVVPLSALIVEDTARAL